MGNKMITDEAELKDKVRHAIYVWLDLFGREWVNLERYTDARAIMHEDVRFTMLERLGMIEQNPEVNSSLLDIELRLTDFAIRFLEDESVVHF